MNPRSLLTLSVLPERYAICRLQADEGVPPLADAGDFVSISRTRDELSIVCLEKNVPAGIQTEFGWRTLKCEGHLDLTVVGVIVSIAEPLAAAGVPIFPIATHNTDYVLVKELQLEIAIHALTAYGHAVRG